MREAVSGWYTESLAALSVPARLPVLQLTHPKAAVHVHHSLPPLRPPFSACSMLYIADPAPRRFAVEQLAVLGGFAELCCRKLEEGRLEELRATAAAAAAGTGARMVRE